MANFPVSLDNLVGSQTLASADIAGVVNAVEAKLGIGSSTPTLNNMLIGTGTGSSTWSKAAPTGTIVGTTDSQTLTNKILTTPVINAGSDATGDIYYRSGTVFTRLAIGSTGQALVVSGGLPAWSASSSVGSDGFVDDTASTWTYASATTITVPTDATTKFSVGDKIRLKQGGSYLYFYVVGVAATLLTITGGSDYTLANAVITNQAYSKMQTPLGFPTWMNCPQTSATGWTTAPNVGSRFKVEGRTATLTLWFNATPTSNATTITFIAPVTSSNATNYVAYGSGRASDNGSNLTNPARVSIGQNTTTINANKDWSGAAWTGSAGKTCEFTLSWEI